MNAFKYGLLIAVVTILASCAPKANISTYWINSIKVDCETIAPTECLMIQKGEVINPTAWENLYAPIQGFDFEMGYLYQIQVEEKQLAAQDIPADASSIEYSLVKVLKKEADPKLRLNDIWVCSTLLGKEVTSSEKPITLEIHLKDRRIMGNDGCNNFNGGIETVGQDILKLGPVMGTRMMCQEMEMPDNFNMALYKVEKYEIKDMTLYLYCEEGNELMTLKKVD